MLNWTPEGGVGQLFRAMKPFAPPPPPGALPAPLWGSEEHVRELFGRQVWDVDFSRGMLELDLWPTPEAVRDYFKRLYGPTIAVYRANADDAAKTAALDDALLEFAARTNLAEPGRPARYEYEYAVILTRRA